MEGMEAGSVQLELKYCERCGGLWLRLRGSDLVFCSACAKSMAGLWPRLGREGSGDANTIGARGQFWSEGGNA